jgi:hypothetical protein
LSLPTRPWISHGAVGEISSKGHISLVYQESANIFNLFDDRLKAADTKIKAKIIIKSGLHLMKK